MADSSLDDPGGTTTTDDELPAPTSDNMTRPLHCCCGRPACAFLKHNYSALDNVEKDVQTAAKMGQALLARHEAYMADAERDRNELTARIEQLELEKRKLEADNAKIDEENKLLRDHLDLLNNTVTDSGARISSLEAALQSSEQAVRRLERAAARAADMERHILMLEEEQAALQRNLFNSKTDTRSAVQRWQRAERGLADLQEQLERIEKEAAEERERHAEVMERVERQRGMERELDTAAGRLKGAAAVKSLASGKNSQNVVSHFVRDLLQDNANLQLGMAELREMLMNSNDEIQMLREQLVYHQPAAESDVSAASTLRAELDMKEERDPRPPPLPPQVSQALHIHHHYHVTPKAEPKKPKKKRQMVNPHLFTPPHLSAPSTPPSTRWRLHPSSPAPAALAAVTADSTSAPSMPVNRWSVLSEHPSDFAPSSVPSSPQSNYPNSSFFDRTDAEYSSSLPDSPATSIDPSSPSFRTHRQRPSTTSTRHFQYPIGFSDLGSSPPRHRQPQQQLQHTPSPHPLQISHPIIEETTSEDGTVGDANDLQSPTAGSTTSVTDVTDEDSFPHRGDYEQDLMSNQRPRLRRTMSHESIMSLTGGLDIHTLKARPSQLALRPLGAASVVAEPSVFNVTARSTLSRDHEGKRGSAILRDNLAVVLPSPRTVSSPIAARLANTAALSASPSGGGSKLGKLVSWRPWGGAGFPTTPTSANSSTAASGSVSKPAPAPCPKEKEIDHSALQRAPGINQPGAIPGFYEYFAARQRRDVVPSKVAPDNVDRDALRDGLEG